MSNVAVTAFAAAMEVKVQVSPVHSAASVPVHSTKVEPSVGVAVRVTVSPAS